MCDGQRGQAGRVGACALYFERDRGTCAEIRDPHCKLLDQIQTHDYYEASGGTQPKREWTAQATASFELLVDPPELSPVVELPSSSLRRLGVGVLVGSP